MANATHTQCDHIPPPNIVGRVGLPGFALSPPGLLDTKMLAKGFALWWNIGFKVIFISYTVPKALIRPLEHVFIVISV